MEDHAVDVEWLIRVVHVARLEAYQTKMVMGRFIMTM